MTLKHMKIYLAVYRHENITRAARELYMTQPAVTRAIRELEQYYGVRLFERMNRRLRVTESGRLFYEYALHITDSVGQMEKELRNWDELGLLRIGASITLGNILVPPVLLRFRNAHPALQIRCRISNGADLEQALLGNELDFALLEGSPDNPQLVGEPLACDRLILILPPDDPRAARTDLTLQDFEKDTFLLREEGSLGRSLIDHVFAARGIPLKPMLESVSTQAILRAVHAGLGISLLPELLVQPAVAAGAVAAVELSDEKFLRTNSVVYHRNKFLPASARQLMDAFREAGNKIGTEDLPGTAGI